MDLERFRHVPGSLMVVMLLFNWERRCDLILMGKSEVLSSVWLRRATSVLLRDTTTFVHPSP